MSKKSFLTIAAVALALQAASVAQAAVTLWDNGGPSASNLGSQMSAFNQAADFTTTFKTDLSAVSFWSLEGGPNDYAGSIFYRIVGNAGGSPDDANVIASGSVNPTRSSLGAGVNGLNVVKNDFNIVVANLLAGTYWLELHNGGLGVGSDAIDFYWSFADLNATNTPSNRDQEISLFPPDLTWGTNDQEHAFLISGDRVIDPPPNDVPEPATLVLAGLAMGAATLGARRRRRA